MSQPHAFKTELNWRHRKLDWLRYSARPLTDGSRKEIINTPLELIYSFPTPEYTRGTNHLPGTSPRRMRPRAIQRASRFNSHITDGSGRTPAKWQMASTWVT